MRRNQIEPSAARLRLIAVFPIVVAVGLLSRTSSADDRPTLPFSLDLGLAYSIPGVGGLQAYAAGSADVDGTKWLLVGGLTRGVHGFAPETGLLGENFPKTSGNARLIVVDPSARRCWSCPVDALTGIDTAPLRSADAASCQEGDTLYLVGGYGHSATAPYPGGMTTFSTLTAIDLPKAIKAIIAGKSPDGSATQVSDPRLKATGASLEKMGDTFYLLFGQTFDGLYSPVMGGQSAPFSQSYRQSVLTFTLTAGPALGLASVKIIDTSTTLPAGRRRDYSTAPALFPSPIPGAPEVPTIGIYGGVFQSQGFSAFLTPIYLQCVSGDGQKILPGEDANARQLLSQYACPVLPVYDPATSSTITVFFGGISQYRYDPDTGKLVKDQASLSQDGTHILRDGMPYVDTVSALRRGSDGTSAGFILAPRMPGFLGSSGQLLIEPDVAGASGGVVRLDRLKGPTTIGVIFGGIRSSSLYSTQSNEKPPTVASDLFIPVILKPGSSRVIAMPPKP
jgi:hypothetical protein